MSNDNKVVPLRTGRVAPGALPQVLADLQNRGWLYLSDCAQKLLDNADDALFELADRALHANEQNLYFEAMREIRVHRRRIEEAFRIQLGSPFQALIQADRNARTSAQPLELLDYEDMEEQVAVESMASKASKRYAQALSALTASFQAWADSQGVGLTANENLLPFTPLSICDAFAQSTRDIELNIKPKLVLFKLFDRHVVSELGGLYLELSTVLKSAGLYREGDSVLRPRADELDPPAEAPAAVEAESEPVDIEELAQQTGGTVFDVLKGLLAAGGDSGGKIQLSRGSLLKVLQELQGSQLERMNVVSLSSASPVAQLPPDLADRLRNVQRDVLDESDETVAQRDFDVINLVSLLFQYVLEDDSLASPMRALIAHLQIPVLKAAMLDKRFFSKEGHPARLLLNTIADACIGWQPTGDLDNDPLYAEVDSLVRDVLARADGQARVFQEALDDFKAYLEQERRRADLVTQRVLNADDSKQVAAQARELVDSLLQSKLKEVECPEVLTALLTNGWSKVLFLQYIQQGEGSDAWKDAVSVVDDLLWSVQPVSSIAHRDKLLTDLPSILERLRAGLNQIGYNPYDLKEQLQQLETVHMGLLKKSRDVNNNNNQAVKEPPMSPKPVESFPEKDIDLDALDASLAASLGEGPTATDSELADAERRLSRLQVGNWVEFLQDDGSRLRCRLAAVIASTGRHIFVNRSGMKVAEHEKDHLLHKLVDQKMTMLDDGMLFDRALESVISNLRDMKDKPV
ncbi:hypothetical protein FHR99_002297 [Litorivivens lipolytica]|uniref:Thymidine phosphorylase n=1 Tax=Litorivivens lipolytica TaxID=1524264 RepID=A0A7W4Z7L5_9GAMM|nr:DUF1631 domain-containing protein [Litorivivens lipolytica]MBB3048031.1 hypothetical protein [Litorivivens lipolytica]